MNARNFPALQRALVEIAYDNGMVNRDHPEWSVIYDMFLLIEKKYSALQISKVDRELAALTADQLLEACTGGCGPEGRDVPISTLADEMLDWAFDGDLPTLPTQGEQS